MDHKLRIRVRGGTAQGSGDLCTTCAHAIIIIGSNNNERIKSCSEISADKDPQFDVKECTNYQNKLAMALGEMKRIAWILQTDAKKKFGFVAPKEDKLNRRYYDDD